MTGEALLSCIWKVSRVMNPAHTFTMLIHPFYTFACIFSIYSQYTFILSTVYIHMHPFYKCTMHNAHCTMHIELLIFLYKHNTVARSKSIILDKNAHSSFLRSWTVAHSSPSYMHIHCEPGWASWYVYSYTPGQVIYSSQNSRYPPVET